MNGVLALGHFCESHGPCVVLNTKMYKEEPNPGQHNLSAASCDACQSLQLDQALISRDKNCIYITTRTSLEQDLSFLLKHATVRSLSCEQEGQLYFGDNDRGHVFSYSFSVHDSLARGFQRKYTILMLSKEKIQLLNNWTILSKHIKEIAKYLQTCSTEVNEIEQIQKPQRAVRQAQGSPSNSGRSLSQLTGRPAIYAHLHLWFCWLLGCTMVIKKTTVLHMSLPTPKPSSLLRTLFQDMGEINFQKACTLVLVGVKIISADDFLISALNSLLPNENWCHNGQVCLIERNVDGKWLIEIDSTAPTQISTLQSDIERALSDARITEAALEPHLSSIIMQWLHVSRVLCWCPHIDIALLHSLNVQKCDVSLLVFWTSQCSETSDKHKMVVKCFKTIFPNS